MSRACIALLVACLAQRAAGAPKCTAWTGPPPQVSDAGDTLALYPVEGWFVHAIAWAGDDLLLLRRVTELPYGNRINNVLERYTVRASSPPRRTWLLGDFRAMATSADGTEVVLGGDRVVSIRDAATGAEQNRFTVDEPIGTLVTSGSGSKLLVAVAGQRAQLYARDGAKLASYTLDGTTPTITRVYHGGNTEHDNILKDDPTWPVAIAISDDQQRVAIGGSDSKIRVFDRRTAAAKPKRLEFKWTYVEHRGLGGNPDLNTPIALRFSSDGAQLTSAHVHGELIRWNVAKAAIAKLDTGCSTAEARALVNQFNEPNDPVREPTADERAACGGATRGTISPDGTRLATLGGLLRVRPLPSGDGEMIPDTGLAGFVAFSRGNTLAIGDIYGYVRLWSAGATAARAFLAAPASTSPRTPTLSDDGRFLFIDTITHKHAWDLRDGRSLTSALAPSVQLLAIGEGGRVVVAKGGKQELRAAGATTGVEVALGEHPRFSADGHRVMGVMTTVGANNSLVSNVVVRDVDRGTEVAIPIDGQRARPALRGDGKRLATFGDSAPTEIWDTTTGKVVATLAAGVRAFAFFHDNRRVVAVRVNGNTATAQIVDGARVVSEIPLKGWLVGVTVSPDDATVLVALEDHLTRIAVASGKTRDAPFVAAQHAHYTTTGLVAIESYYRVELRRDDDALSPVATITMLGSGGYLVASAAGAVEGSPDAADQAVVSRTRSGTVAVAPGSTAWSKFARPNVYACALTGAAIAP